MPKARHFFAFDMKSNPLSPPCAQAALRALRAVLGAAGAAALLALLALVGAAVLLRYGPWLGVRWVGADELAVWLHLAMIALAAPLALGSSLSMRLDVLRQALPPAGRAVCDALADALTLLSAWVIATGSWQLVQALGGASPALGLPEWWRLALFLPCGALLALHVALLRLSEGRGRLLLAAAALAGGMAWGAPGAGWWAALPWPPSAAAALVAALGMAVAAPLPHVFLAAAWLSIPLSAAQGGALSTPVLFNAAVHGMSPFLLLAIPFFLLAGAWLTASGMAARLVRLAAALVGHWRAGLAQTTLLTSVFFSGASGSSVANAAFGAATFQRELVQHGYPPARAGALIAAASVLDNLIPPSIALLILASVTQLPVGRLFVTGAYAGLLMALCLGLAFHWTARRAEPRAAPALTPNPTQNPTPTNAPPAARPARASAAQRRAAAVGALPALGLAVIVLLGIRLGLVTTTEAAALAALYTLGLNLWQRSGARALWQAVRHSATEAAAIALLIGSAAPLAFLLALDGIPAALAQWSSQWASSLGAGVAPVALMACLLLLAAGLVLDIGAAIVLLAPLLLPLAVQAGADPVAFGVVMVVALMIGGLTPPVGLLVFVVAGVSGVPARQVFAAGWPYLLALLAALALLCATLL